MNKKLTILAAALLNRAGGVYGRHCCNDMDQELLDAMGFTEDEKVAVADEYSKWNSKDPEEATTFERIPDFAWMHFLAYKLVEDIND